MLVVNDGSTDGSLAILHEYAATNACIRVLTQLNRGQAAARNTALQQAKGEWILFLDADDYWGDDYLKHIIPDLSDDIDVLQTGYTQKHPIRCTRRYRFLSAWSKVIRREFLIKNHILFPEGLYYDDPVWAATLWKTNPHIAVSESTDYNYTINSQSITANPKSSVPVRKELRKMGLRLWTFGWLRLRLTAHFIKQRRI